MGIPLEEQLADLKRTAEKEGWSERRLDTEEELLKSRFRREGPSVSSPASYRSSAQAGGAGEQQREPLDRDYVVAPYRFVELLDAVVLPPHSVSNALGKEANLHNKPLQDGFSGRIVVDWEVETPLLIGDEGENTTQPLKLGNDYWMPGATLRGLIRSAAEIVGFARLSQANRHHTYGLRDFMHPYYNGKGVNGSPITKIATDADVSDGVRVGWLRITKNKETPDKPTWSIELSELAFIAISELMKSRAPLENYRPRKEGDSWIKEGLKDKYNLAGMGAPNNGFNFAKTISVNVSKGEEYKENVATFGGGRSGVLVFSGKSPGGKSGFEKRKEYVFLTKPGDRTERQELKKEEVDQFLLLHTKPGSGEVRKADGSWKLFETMADNGEAIPVFYVKKPGEEGFAFGLTRLFKIPHRYSVGTVIDQQTAHAMPETDAYKPDFVEALFGHVHEGKNGQKSSVSHHLKGRVAFSGAVITKADRSVPDVTQTYNTVMMAPRASFAPFYLAGDIKDWSDDQAKIAGRKRYLPRTVSGSANNALSLIEARLKRQIDVLSTNARDNDDVKSRITMLHDETARPLVFQSFIDVHNVTQEELGLLLFVLTFNGDTAKRHMIGRGKPFGMGQSRVAEVDLTGVKSNYGHPNYDLEISCIAALQSHIRAAAGAFGIGTDKGQLAKFPAVGSITEFMASCDPSVGSALPGPKIKVGQNEKFVPILDNYLRLEYKAVVSKSVMTTSVKPYANLRKATMLLEGVAKPQGHPKRLLPPV